MKPRTARLARLRRIALSITCVKSTARKASNPTLTASPNVFVFISVYGLPIPVYLWCTLRRGEHQRIAVPSSLHIGLQLLLPRPHPRGVMLLGHLHAAMAEHHGNPLQRHTRQQQFCGEGVAETMRVAIRHGRQFKYPAQAAHVGASYPVAARFTAPKKVRAVHGIKAVQSPNDELR